MPVTHTAANRSGPAGASGGPAWARRAARRLAAPLVAAAAVAGPLAVTPQVLAQPAQARGQLQVYIESVSPQWARPGHTVTVSGIVRNGTRQTQDGLSVQLRSSASPLTNRDDLSLYASGDLAVDAPEGVPTALPSAIPPGRSVDFKLTLNPAVAGLASFGVYPLAVQVVDSATATLATGRTFLPYWQGNSGLKPKRLKVGWLWPILAQPQQGVCRSLLSNGLAGSVASNGRLAGLLGAGHSYSTAAQLTWAIDPAVVRTAQTMSHPYAVQTHAGCSGAKAMPADSAAGDWVSGLTQAITGQQAFLTPYADVDVAALSHAGLDSDLRSAFAESRTVGSKIPGLPTGPDTIAWPQDGQADAGVLGSLAINGIGTVVLDSTVMPPKDVPPPNYTPSAQASADTQVGSSLHVLLADHTISQLLATPATGPGSAFATEQSFLAQTAMIVAELPATARSLVVAPPRLWDPAPGLASGLLRDTVHAPWLRPTSLSSLAAQAHPTGQVPRRAPPAEHVSHAELSRSYLSQVSTLSAAIRVQASIFTPADPGYLSGAVAALESSNWLGSRAQSAAARLNLLDQVQDFVASQARKVGIIDSGRQITLSGSSGRVPVSIFNGLHTAVRVKLHVAVPTDGRLSIGPFKSELTIAAGETTTITLLVHASTVGATEMTLSLLTPTRTELPKTTVELPVHATRFGTLALVILSVALALFVLASFGRAVRRSRRDGGQQSGQHGPDVSGPPGTAAVAGSVSSGEDLETDDPPEDPDEYADARGRARG
ncbi:MAG TPA: DUF6049 family protein [Streptosporangiaceae bacterium]